MCAEYNYSFTKPEEAGKNFVHVADLVMSVYADLQKNAEVPTMVGIKTVFKDKQFEGFTLDEMAHTISSLIVYHLSIVPKPLQASTKVQILTKIVEHLQNFEPTVEPSKESEAP